MECRPESALGTQDKHRKRQCREWKQSLDIQHLLSDVANIRASRYITTAKGGSPCQDPACNRTTRRSADHCRETPFIRSGQNHLARRSERGKKTRQTEEEVGRHQGMDRPGARPEGSREQGRTEETGCEIICGAQTTLTVEG